MELHCKALFFTKERDFNPFAEDTLAMVIHSYDEKEVGGSKT